MHQLKNICQIYLILITAFLFSAYHAEAFTCGADTVSYGGKNYQTVQIGTQCWFKENLNVGTMLGSGATLPSDPAPTLNSPNTVQKWCYNNDTNICNTEGGLYTWAEANGLASTCNTTSCAVPTPNQGICPTGWHIPTHDEYTTLERVLCTSGTCLTDFPFDTTTTGWRGTNEGTQLKTVSVNTFSGLLAGLRNTDGSFGYRGTYGYWSSASEYSTTDAWRRTVTSSNTTIARARTPKLYGWSVRCVMNITSAILTTSPITAITATSATGNGSVADTGGENPVRYIEWGTASGTYTQSCNAGTGGAGAYSCAMTGLTPETTYYVRAKSVNSAGTSYGEEITFTTPVFICGTDTVTRDGLTYGTVMGEDGNCWLDRNLGAMRVATVYNDAQAYGWYFQWGRNADGHQYSTSGTTTTLSTSDTPGHANFIKSSAAPYDWRTPQNDNLWQEVNGVNNPCPAGFRLPTQAEWIAEVSAANITNHNTAFSSVLRLTAAGYRDPSNAAFGLQGSYGYYLASDPISTNAANFRFTSSDVIPNNSGNRAYGLSVRCIMDVLPASFATVITSSASATTEHTTTLNAEISDIGADNPTRAIEYGTQSGTYTSECTAGTGATGQYSCQISNLQPNTTYYYRAKATNSAGTSYGSEMSFTTLPLQDTTITDPTPTDISSATQEGYFQLNTGTITNTDSVTTTVNVTIQDTIFNAVFPQNTTITETANQPFNFQFLTAQNVTNTVQQDQPTSRAAVRIGIPGEKLNFSQNVTLTVSVGHAFNGQTLDILYQQEGESTWNSHGTCTVSNGDCVFTTNHATIYTINGNHQTTGDTPMNLNVQVQETLSMDCFDPSDSNTTVSLGTTTNPGMITAGTPAVGQSRCTVTTNADQGYYLTLTNANPSHATLTHTDPHTATLYEITDQTPWNETAKTTQNWTAPTTKGLSFSVTTFPEADTTHNQFSGVWNQTNQCPEGVNPDTNDYAGIPTTPQAIAAVTSYQSNATTTNICYKVDVPASQPSGQYSGQVMFTATSDASGYWE